MYCAWNCKLIDTHHRCEQMMRIDDAANPDYSSR